jgi:autotransporter-associated beta strand protein
MSKKLNHSLAIGIFLIGLLSVNVSQAQTTWGNTGSEWTSGTSWVGGAAPANSTTATTNIAVFSNAAAGFNTVNFSSDRRIHGVQFTAGANAYTFTGSTLTINGAYGITNSSANLQTFSNKVINASGNATYGSYTAGGSLVFAGGIDLTDSGSTSNRTLTLGGSGNTTVSGTIANGGTATAGAVTIASTALTTLSGDNTYGGATTVSSGATLRLGSATALGATDSGTGVSGGGALDLNGQTIGQEALSISGSGVSSSGSLFNSSSSAASWSGNIAPTANSTIKATNGSIGISGGINLNGDGATSRTLTLDGTGGIVLSGNISNSFAGSTGNIAIAANARNVTLSGNNSYNGTTTINNFGAMNINSANAISTNTFIISGDSFLNNTSGGAITNLGNNNITLGDRFTFGTSSSTATNSLNLGTGTVTVTGGRLITIEGSGVTLGLGTLDSTSALAGGRTHTANGVGNTLSLAGWKIQSGSSSNVVATLAGSANWMIGGPIVNGNVFSNGVQIDAIGLTTFGGNNTYDGTTIVSSNATLRITSATGLGSTNTGTTVSAGGQLQLSGGITVNAGEALSLSGTNGSTATLRNISGNNTYNGAITFNSGTNRIDSDAGTLTLSSFTNTLSSTRPLLVGGAGDTTFTGRFTGTGSALLTKDGAGTLTLANTNFDIGGGVLVNNGKLALAATNALGASRAVVINGGTLDITTFDNTVGAVSLTNGTIVGSTGVLTGTSYAVEGGTISARLGGGGALTKSGLGTVTLSGSNSYSGNTVIASAGVLKLESTNSLSKNSSLLGASGGANTGTLDLNAEGNYVANSFGTALTGGFNMNFTNSSGSAATLTFTNADNYLTIASNNSAGRALNNLSSNLDIRFDGNIEIGSTALNDKAIEFAGPGSFRVDGAVKNSGSAVRGLIKTGSGTLTLAGTGNDYDGTTAVDGGTLLLTNSATLTESTALTVSTAGTASSSSATRTAAATLNVASGSSLLSGSTTTVYSGGNLIVNGTAGSVVVETNGLVGGSGTVGSVNLKRGAVLNPGNSPGLLTASEAIWAAGSTYNWEINDADGTAGTNWDLFSVTGALDLSALSSSAKMNLVLNSLSLANFSTSSPDSWVIAQAGSFFGTGLANGTNVTDLFNINATAFNNGDLPNGGFKIEVGTDANNLRTLNLMAIPEPSTGSMLGLGFAGLVVTRLLRRKIS